jgi:hypothetical protein
MTEAHPAHSTGGASRDDEGATAALGLAEWLCLAATPTFAIMALLTMRHFLRGELLRSLAPQPIARLPGCVPVTAPPARLEALPRGAGPLAPALLSTPGRNTTGHGRRPSRSPPGADSAPRRWPTCPGLPRAPSVVPARRTGLLPPELMPYCAKFQYM